MRQLVLSGRLCMLAVATAGLPRARTPRGGRPSSLAVVAATGATTATGFTTGVKSERP